MIPPLQPNAADTPRVSPRALHKGQQTRAAILDAALGLASHMGLEGLSIGALAEVTQMSKSGVFAHFGSREELQISVICEYHTRFEEEVFFPAMREPRGLPRLQALFDRWIRRVSVELDSGCIYISGAVEFDDRPGPVRDALARMVLAWHAALARAIRIAVDAGQLRADTDADQMLFELHGLILALHHDARFLRTPGALGRARAGFERTLSHYALSPNALSPNALSPNAVSNSALSSNALLHGAFAPNAPNAPNALLHLASPQDPQQTHTPLPPASPSAHKATATAPAGRARTRR